MRKVRKSHAKHGRIELTLMALIVVATAFTGAYAAAFTGVTNYWVGAAWADYNDAANWRVNDPDTGANAVPTANDMIYLNSSTTYKIGRAHV